MSVVPGLPRTELARSGMESSTDYSSTISSSMVDFASTRRASTEFSVERVGSGVMSVGIRGEIDLFSAPDFRDYVCSQISPEGQFILDMSRVDFIGTAGLVVIDDLHTRNIRDGRTWAIICGRPVYRLLRAAGRESAYPCFASVDSALGAWHDRSA